MFPTHIWQPQPSYIDTLNPYSIEEGRSNSKANIKLANGSLSYFQLTIALLSQQ